jgi:hypothetical protein
MIAKHGTLSSAKTLRKGCRIRDLSVNQVTYKQNWPAYNAAQMEEKERFIVLLNALCQLVEQPAQANGRPRLPLADMIFACVYKVYCCFSSRRFMSDLREAQVKEHIHQYLGQLRKAEGRWRSMNTAQAGDLVANLGH